MSGISLAALDVQEARFAAAFAARDLDAARGLYRPDVVYVSPTTRLFGWPTRVVGVDATLEFVARTLEGVDGIDYSVVERAVVPGGSAFVLVRFDFEMSGARLRSTYVVRYRHVAGAIARQELYYDPSGELERLGTAGD